MTIIPKTMYLLYKIAVFLSLTLPLEICYWLADSLGSLYYLLAKKDRQVVFNNLKVVLDRNGGLKRTRQLTRLVFTNFGRYLVEFFRTPIIDLKFLRKNVTIDGLDHLLQARRLGKGVLLLSAHLGNWELGAMVLAMLGYKVNVVAWTHKNRMVNDFFVRQRQSKGIDVIPLGSGLKKVFSALRRNEQVAILGDIDYVQPDSGIAVTLFGQKTLMPKGAALFSLRTGAPIVPAFFVREANNKFKFILRPAIQYQPSGNYESDLRKLTQRVAQVLETDIALCPEQWFMLKPRWPLKHPD